MTGDVIQCDQDACDQRITLSHDVDETQAAAIARAAQWTAQMGARRWYHRCPRHSEVRR